METIMKLNFLFLLILISEFSYGSQVKNDPLFHVKKAMLQFIEKEIDKHEEYIEDFNRTNVFYKQVKNYDWIVLTLKNNCSKFLNSEQIAFLRATQGKDWQKKLQQFINDLFIIPNEHNISKIQQSLGDYKEPLSSWPKLVSKGYLLHFFLGAAKECKKASSIDHFNSLVIRATKKEVMDFNETWVLGGPYSPFNTAVREGTSGKYGDQGVCGIINYLEKTVE